MSSTFTSKTKEVMENDLASTWAFVERMSDEKVASERILNIDINKSRTNRLLDNNHDFCQCTVMDYPVPYQHQPGQKIKPGRYYVETDQYLPFRANGWYYHPLVEYGLEAGLIQPDQIKHVMLSSVTVPKGYFNKFIEYLKTILTPSLAKLAVNSMIGSFKPKDREHWKAICMTSNPNVPYYH